MPKMSDTSRERDSSDAVGSASAPLRCEDSPMTRAAAKSS